MQINFEISPIIYRRKEIDHGVILGSRKYKWMLKRKYSPLYAKDLGDKCYITALSPHKRDFQVYIPASSLKIGMKILIHDHPYKQNTVKKTLKVVKISRNNGIFGLGDSVICEVEKEEVIEAKIDFSQTGETKPIEEIDPGDQWFVDSPVYAPEKTPEPVQEPIEDETFEEEPERMSFDEYIGSYEDDTPQEVPTEPVSSDNPTMFVMPETQTLFELPKGANYMQRRTFLKMPLVVAATRVHADDHAEQQAFTLPVCPLPVRKHQIIMPEQPLLIALSGHQYGLFERSRSQ